MNHVSPQGGSISRLYPTCYNTKVYTGGIYVHVYSNHVGTQHVVKPIQLFVV